MNIKLAEVLDGVLPELEVSAGTASGVATDEPAMLTSEERVVKLLSEKNGYTWQGEIAEAFGWSAAKTSRTLTKMETKGRITRYRVGRRKVVCLPNQEPECLQVERRAVASS